MRRGFQAGNDAGAIRNKKQRKKDTMITVNLERHALVMDAILGRVIVHTCVPARAQGVLTPLLQVVLPRQPGDALRDHH